ncbi:hypothetical protein F4782DRAFT_29079 [Xylaria castorea]|nr:hypothetical protein F4782DRAFT_29079 [Xylaria castorea]
MNALLSLSHRSHRRLLVLNVPESAHYTPEGKQPPPDLPKSTKPIATSSIAHTPAKRSPSSTSTSTPTPTPANNQYPIMPSFGDWQFPHHNLPKEWNPTHEPPEQQPPGPSLMAAYRCYLADFQIGVQKCHLIPTEQNEWFHLNQMDRYTNNTGRKSPIDDAASRDNAGRSS